MVGRRAFWKLIDSFDWRHWLLVGAFAFALGFAGLHAFRFVRDAIYWDMNRDEAIQGWMNVDFVAHSYHVPPPALFDALGLPAKPPDKRPLSDIALAQGKSLDAIEKTLTHAIAAARPPAPSAKP